jgi:hypothetical protein
MELLFGKKKKAMEDMLPDHVPALMKQTLEGPMYNIHSAAYDEIAHEIDLLSVQRSWKQSELNEKMAALDRDTVCNAFDDHIALRDGISEIGRKIGELETMKKVYEAVDLQHQQSESAYESYVSKLNDEIAFAKSGRCSSSTDAVGRIANTKGDISRTKTDRDRLAAAKAKLEAMPLDESRALFERLHRAVQRLAHTEWKFLAECGMVSAGDAYDLLDAAGYRTYEHRYISPPYIWRFYVIAALMLNDGTLDEAISQLEKVYENGHARGLMFDWS